MNGVFYSRAAWTAPWGLTLPPMGNLWFHAVISGQALLEVPGAPPTWLNRGDLGLVAHGKGHVLRSDSSADPLDISELDDERMISDRYEEIRHGGGGAPTTAICGAFVVDHPAARDVLDVLPPALHVEPVGRPSDWLPRTLGMMAAEAREPRPGGEAVQPLAAQSAGVAGPSPPTMPPTSTPAPRWAPSTGPTSVQKSGPAPKRAVPWATNSSASSGDWACYTIQSVAPRGRWPSARRSHLGPACDRRQASRGRVLRSAQPRHRRACGRRPARSANNRRAGHRRSRVRAHTRLGRRCDQRRRDVAARRRRGRPHRGTGPAQGPPAYCHVWQAEIFGPVLSVTAYDRFDEAVDLANGTDHGLQAGIFTASIDLARQALDDLEFSAVVVNRAPTFRADQMPYGGIKGSGNTREGPAYTIRELVRDQLMLISSAASHSAKS